MRGRGSGSNFDPFALNPSVVQGRFYPLGSTFLTSASTLSILVWFERARELESFAVSEESLLQGQTPGPGKRGKVKPSSQPSQPSQSIGDGQIG
jgi:hypothetical protein